MKFKTLLLTVICVFVSACGDGTQDFIDDLEDAFHKPTPTATATLAPNVPTAAPQPTDTPRPVANPLCVKVMGCSEGFLWKPVSDSTSQLAVHLPAKFSTKFDKCSVYLKGSVSSQPMAWGGFGNGNRQLWRAKSAGSKYDGRVICEEMKQKCEWLVNKNNGDTSKRCE